MYNNFGLNLPTLIILFFITSTSQAQISLSGSVVGDDGYSLIGVNVLEENTSNGTVTDLDGNYQISVSVDSKLTFSYVGYETQTFEVGLQTEIHVVLNTDAALIDEIVVTGYSIDSRRKTSGSVSTIKARDLQIAPSGNVEQQLQGRVPGLTVISNGQPGTTSQVRVRGYGSLGGNAPLYIVDGVPVSSIDFLSPGDIETTTVLKDASAASIYGARAAGGVIVYTTQKGKKGKQKMRISYDGMVGITSPQSGRPMMDPQDQADWTWNAIRNAATLAGVAPEFNHPQYGSGPTPVLPDYLLVGTEAGVIGALNLEDHRDLYNIDQDDGPIYQVVRAHKNGTNWYDAITQNALISRHHLGISGGGDGSQYYLGFGFQDQEGIIHNQKFSRYSFRANTEFDILPILRIGENFQGTYRSTRILSDEAGGIGSADQGTFISGAHRTSPIVPIYDEFGGWAGSASPGIGLSGNGVAGLDNAQDDRDFTAQAFGNVYMELEPFEGLVFRSSFGGQFVTANNRRYGKEGYYNRGKPQANYSQFSSYASRWTWTNTANYKKTIGIHDLDILLGQEALNQGSGRTISGAGIDPFSQNVDFVGLSTVSNRTVDGSPFNGVRFSSYFTRLNYVYNDKYIASIVMRRDGSSRFGE